MLNRRLLSAMLVMAAACAAVAAEPATLVSTSSKAPLNCEQPLVALDRGAFALCYDKGGQVAILLSTDGGKTWGAPIDAGLKITDEFETCMAGTDLYISSGAIFVKFTFDGKSLKPSAPVNLGENVLTAHLAPDGNGRIWVSYTKSDGAAATMCVQAIEKGSLQPQAAPINPLSHKNATYSHASFIADKGRIGIVYMRNEGAKHDAFIRWHADGDAADNWSPEAPFSKRVAQGLPTAQGPMAAIAMNSRAMQVLQCQADVWTVGLAVQPTGACGYQANPSLSTDGKNAWLVWSSFAWTNSYDLLFSRFDASTKQWSDVMAFNLDGKNNRYPKLPANVAEQKTVPLVYAQMQDKGSDIKCMLLTAEDLAKAPDPKVKIPAWLGDSKYFTLTTKPAKDDADLKEFSFAVMGDLHVDEIPKTVVALLGQVNKVSPKPAFLMAVGDLSIDRYYEWQMKAYVRVLKEYMDPDIRHAPCPGNHDGHLNKDMNGPEMYEKIIVPTTISKARPAASPYYSFDYGNCHFASLNYYWKFDQAQIDWLKTDLQRARANSRIKHIFVYGHAPLAPTYVADTLSKGWADALQQVLTDNKVDAYFCGHVHAYHRTVFGGVPQITTGGAAEGASLTGDAGGHAETLFRHFVLVQVSGEKVRLKVIDKDGNVAEEFDLADLVAGKVPDMLEALKKYAPKERKP